VTSSRTFCPAGKPNVWITADGMDTRDYNNESPAVSVAGAGAV